VMPVEESVSGVGSGDFSVAILIGALRPTDGECVDSDCWR
jgi:hypothetical protein